MVGSREWLESSTTLNTRLMLSNCLLPQSGRTALHIPYKSFNKLKKFGPISKCLQKESKSLWETCSQMSAKRIKTIIGDPTIKCPLKEKEFLCRKLYTDQKLKSSFMYPNIWMPLPNPPAGAQQHPSLGLHIVQVFSVPARQFLADYFSCHRIVQWIIPTNIQPITWHSERN